MSDGLFKLIVWTLMFVAGVAAWAGVLIGGYYFFDFLGIL